jgi:hypothetical protein
MPNSNKDKFKRKEKDGLFVKKTVLKTNDSVDKNKTYKLGKLSISVSKSRSKPSPENIKSGTSKTFKHVVKEYGTPDDYELIGVKQKSKEFDGTKYMGNAKYAVLGRKKSSYRDVTKYDDGKRIIKQYGNENGDGKGRVKNQIEIYKPKSGGKTITTTKYNKKGKISNEKTIYKPSLKEKISTAFNKLKNG